MAISNYFQILGPQWNLRNKNTSNNTKDYGKQYGPANYNTSDYSGYKGSIYDSLMAGGGSWSGGAYRPDTSGVIAAFNKEADALRANAKSQYDTTRKDLLDKFERFKVANEKSRNNQKQSYLTNQSAIELAKEQADRQSRISNSARGLGGSGLQNIAEIQNELGVQGDISKLAGENQYVMDDLTTQLKNEQEDTNKGIANAKTIYDNSLRSIASDLANKIAQANYEADNIYQQSLANARSSYGAASAGANTTASDLISLLNNTNTSLISKLRNTSKKDFISKYGLNKKASSSSVANAIYNDYISQLNGIQGISPDLYKKVEKDIRTATNTWKKYN